MDHLLLAIKGDSTSFPRIAEDLIRREFPETFTFKLNLPVPGKGTREVTITIKTVPFRVGVAIENDGFIHVYVEVEVYLTQISHDLQVNDIFPAGEPIPTTSVLMPQVPPMPLLHDLERPHLIGVPRIDVHVARTTQTIQGDKLRLNAQINPGDIVIHPNFVGLLQVLIRKLTDDITNAIKGAYGDSFLADVLIAVVNFVSVFLRHVLEIFKIPDSIFAELFLRLKRAIEVELTKHWSPREVPLVTVPRVVTIAPAVALPNGRRKQPVNLTIATMAAHANVVSNPRPAKEFVATMGFVEN